MSDEAFGTEEHKQTEGYQTALRIQAKLKELFPEIDFVLYSEAKSYFSAQQQIREANSAKQTLIQQSLSEADASGLIKLMEASAEVAPEIELTPENWAAQFGESGKVATPIGEVKMGDNQLAKLFLKKRTAEFGMIMPTLTNPDVVIEKFAPAEKAERDTKYLFIKTFNKPNGGRIVHFESVTASKDGMEVSISSREVDASALKKEMQNGKILHLSKKLSIGSDEYLTETRNNERPDLVPSSDNSSSKDKGNDNKQETNGSEENISALSQIPVNEKGQRRYEESAPEVVWDAFVEQSHGDEQVAMSVAMTMQKRKAAQLKKLAAKKLADYAKGKDLDSPDVYFEAERKRKEAIAQAQAELDFWDKVANEQSRRQRAAEDAQRELNRQAAEERTKEAAKHKTAEAEAEQFEREALNGVPEITLDKADDARRRGYRRWRGMRIDRQKPISALIGKAISVPFSKSVSQKSNLAIIDAKDLQPSHMNGERNPYHFIDEAQPKERKDAASIVAADDIAKAIRPNEIATPVTAYVGTPTINERGEVIQGNNRSAALRLMWESHKEQASKYKEYLLQHASEFGLDAEKIAAMECPVLVNMANVSDEQAIKLGQYKASDLESGGVERIDPKSTMRKIGDEMPYFVERLLAGDDDMSFAELADKNGDEVLRWLSERKYISATQHQSAYDSKGNLTAEAKNDIKGILYQAIFQGGSTSLEEMFNKLPAKAQKAILATAYRDFNSPKSERMIPELQSAIMAFQELMAYRAFRESKNYKEASEAMQEWSMQFAMDDVSGESYLPSEKYSNFALRLAVMFKGETQNTIKDKFNKIFDLIQGTQEETLFDSPDNTPRTLAQAIKEVLQLDYNGQTRSNVLGSDLAASEAGQRRSATNDSSGERTETRKGQTDSGSRVRTDGEGAREESLQRENTGDIRQVRSEEVGSIIGKSLSEEESNRLVSLMEAKAEEAPELDLTPENWAAQFGVDSKVETPIGQVKIGENQLAKLFEKGRESQFGMIKPTLEHPQVVVEVQSESKEGNPDRDAVYLFIKTFKKEDGSKYIHFESVTVSKDGLEVSISSHIIRENQLKNRIKSGKLLYKATALDESANPSAEQLTNEVGSLSSEDKGNDNKQENNLLEDKSLTLKDRELLNTTGAGVIAFVASEEDPSGTNSAVSQDIKQLILAKAKNVLLKPFAGTKQQIHDAINIQLNNGRRVAANVTILTHIYSLQDAVRRGTISVDEALENIAKHIYTSIEQTQIHREELPEAGGGTHRNVNTSTRKNADASDEQIEQEIEELAAIEDKWDEAIADYIFEHYPTQATVTSATTSEQGLREREAMRNDPVLKRMREDAKKEYAEKEAQLNEDATNTVTSERPSLLEAIKDLYSKGKEYAAKLYQRSYFDVAATPAFMQELGLRGDKFTIRYGVIARHVGKDDSHGLSENDWKQLLQSIQSPFAVTKLKDTDDSYRLYTTLQTERGEYVVVGVDVKNAGRELEVNAISTVFGRRSNANLTQNEEVIYRSKEITPEQLSLLDEPNSHQYPVNQEYSEDKSSKNPQENNKDDENSVAKMKAGHSAMQSIERKERILKEGTGFDKHFSLIPPADIKSANDIDTNIKRILKGLAENEGDGEFEGFAYKGAFVENAGHQIYEYLLSLSGGVISSDVGMGYLESIGAKTFGDLIDYGKREYTRLRDSLDIRVNPADRKGNLVIEKINSISDLTDADFAKPYRSVQLPKLPQNVAEAIGSNGKPVVIKKNIFERNQSQHPDVSAEQSRQILQDALYSTDLYGQSQKGKKPYNWVLIYKKDLNGNNRLVLLEVNHNKENVEIIHWHYVDDAGLNRLKRQAEREGEQILVLPSELDETGALPGRPQGMSNGRQAEREGGQFLILSPQEGSAAALSTLPNDLSSEDKGSKNQGENNSSRKKQTEATERKIDDYGEKIEGARKDALKDLAKTMGDITEQSLVAMSFGKVWKRPNFKKLVESGQLSERDAKFAEAFCDYIEYEKKPTLNARASRWERARKEEKIAKWAKRTKASLDALSIFLAVDESKKIEILNELGSAKPLNGDAETAIAAGIVGNENIKLPENSICGSCLSISPVYAYMQVREKLGLQLGDKLDIKLIITPNSSYSKYNLTKADGSYLYFSKFDTFDEAIDAWAAYVALESGRTDVAIPKSMMGVGWGETEYVKSSEYFYITYPNGKVERSLSRSQADTLAKKWNDNPKHITKVKVEPMVSRQAASYIVLTGNIDGKAIRLSSKKFPTQEDAERAIEENSEALSDALLAENRDRLIKEGKIDANGDKSKDKRPYSLSEDYEFEGAGRNRTCTRTYTWRYYYKALGLSMFQNISPKFYSEGEALKWEEANRTELLEAFEKMKQADKDFSYFASDDNGKNKKDYRGGRDISEKEFADTFGFRGIQFGNWANQSDRQIALNNAYDSFMDLAELLHLTPRALSLAGELGIAFGARGSGGANAHYEPNQVVINLTKTRGAGSLAHEWWHSLDNYFSRAAKMPQGMMTESSITRKLAVESGVVRAEIAQKFASIVDKVEKSTYGKRTSSMGTYWGSSIEQTARLFGAWVSMQMRDNDAHNGFLTYEYNEAKQKEYKQRKYERYKYFEEKAGNTPMSYEEFVKTDKAIVGYVLPVRAELEELSGVVRDLFDTMQERIGEHGETILYEFTDERIEELTDQQKETTDVILDLIADAGIEVSMDEQEMREVYEASERLGEIQKETLETASSSQAKYQQTVVSSAAGAKVLNNLKKAANTIREWLKNDVRNKSFEIELPQYVLNKVRAEMGRNFDTHNITSNGIIHGLKGHGVGGDKLSDRSIPIREEDAALIPYIMTAPDMVVKGSTKNGRESVRFIKNISNGYIVVVEKEFDNSADDLETINIWAELSNVSNAQRTLNRTSETPTIGRSDVAKIRKDAQKAIAQDKLMQFMTVFHGSGASFEQFDHSYMGTGEGAQSYGWGSYVTEVNGIAKSYAELIPWKKRDNIAEKIQNLGELIARLRREISQMEEFAEQHEADIPSEGKLRIQSKISEKRAALEQRIIERQELIESDSRVGNSNIYTVEIPENNGENYLSWNQKYGVKEIKELYARLKPAMNSTDFEDLIEKVETDDDYRIARELSGHVLYHRLESATGSDELASKALSQAGFVGIEYPAEYQPGGRADRAKNYVIFKESDLKIIDRTQFLKTAKGEALGFVKGGKIYLDPKQLNPNTPIHEYTHLWDMALQKANPELWKRGIELMKQLPLWDEIKNNPAYADIAGDENLLASEVHARLTGEQGTALMEQMIAEVKGKSVIAQADRISLIHSLREWIKQAWQWVKDTMMPWTASEASQISLKDFVNMPIKDLVESKRLNEYINGAETHTQFSIVSDQKKIDELESGKTVKVYRAMQLRDGKLYPPMAAKVGGEFVAPAELGVWQQADEDTSRIKIKKNAKGEDVGYYTLNKGNNTSLDARYNPYFHTSRSPLNDQFSSAQDRPELVTVEVEVPESELTSGYRAQYAKDKVGEISWHSGPVSGKLPKSKTRKVILSRWCKPIRIVPESEVAEAVAKLLDGENIVIPSNTVTPQLRKELEKKGLPVVETDNQGNLTNIEDINLQFNARLDNLANNPSQKNRILSLGKAGELLLSAGVSNAEIVLEFDKLVRKSSDDYKNNHPFTARDIKDLPKAINKPIAIFNRKGNTDKVILTELKKNGNNFIVAIRAKEQQRKGGVKLVVHEISTLYPKKTKGIIGWIINGDGAMYDKEKTLRWLKALQPLAETISDEELSSATKVVESFENPKLEAKDDSLHRSGDNSRASRAAAKQKARYTQELAARLNLSNVEIVTDARGLKGKRAKAKGFYEKSSGKITIVVPNNTSLADIEQTLLHEAVAHYGLRQLFGEHFDTFLDEVYAAADMETRHKIVALARKHKWDVRVATEEYLASLAEDTNFEQMSKTLLWQRIRHFFVALLNKLGIKYAVLTDNELRYTLWRSYENLKDGGKGGLIAQANDTAKQYELRVGEFEGRKPTAKEVNDEFNKTLSKLNEQNANAIRLYLGRPSAILRSAGVEDLPMLLYGNKVLAKIKKHGYELGELRNLPAAVANPIAIFSTHDNGYSRAILTELKTKQGNFLVTLRFGKEGNIDFNIVSSVYGKNGNNVVDWINSGAMVYVNKEKALAYLSNSAPIAEATISQELSYAAKVVENFENPKLTTQNDTLFREGDDDAAPTTIAQARSQYERAMKSKAFQTIEAFQDSMRSLLEGMKAICTGEAKYVEDVPIYQNAYLGENALSSVNKAEQDAVKRLLTKPLLQAIYDITGGDELERGELTDYMFAKHGLERNLYMAARDAQRQYDEYIKEHPKSKKTYEEFLEKCRSRDYAGLTALTGVDTVEEAEQIAMEWMRDYEDKHDTANLWQCIRAFNDFILTKSFETGLISVTVRDKIRSMYKHYIPLRGFDEKTAEEAYAYIGGQQDGFSGGVRQAFGRNSKADDPIANMQLMADSAIVQGNRNLLVKQRFLNFVTAHPSDLVGVSELWLEYDEVNDEWVARSPEFEENDTPEQIAQKAQDFEERMRQLSLLHPEKYKSGKQVDQLPYKVVSTRDLKQHQILVKRGGRTIVLTVYGSPRLAQAVNGLTNPDTPAEGAFGKAFELVGNVNRILSATYTTLNPDFVISNFFRDSVFSNTMVWIKESPNYAIRYHRNYAIVNPAMLKSLFAKLRKGTLDMSNPIHAHFKQFVENGGETGYAERLDMEKQKKRLSKWLSRNPEAALAACKEELLATLDECGRAVENCARFAAYLTSRQLGRSVGRSVWDAKEISVNFNKKGAGDRFLGSNGQSSFGNIAAFTSGAGRALYIFWNAALQGTFGNFFKYGSRNTGKMSAALASVAALGMLASWIGKAIGGGGDDDDKQGGSDADNYYNFPTYTRRSNFMFKGFGNTWVKIPLPIEYRAMYGIGEMVGSAIFNGEQIKTGEVLAQFSQLFPVDMLQGQDELSDFNLFEAFMPSSAKPIVEMSTNTSWTGLPIYKDNDYNKHMPEWTKAYKNANPALVGLAKTLSEISGGDIATRGSIEMNPAVIEYFLKSYAPFWNQVNQISNLTSVVSGSKDFDWRYIPLANRVIANGDERTQFRAINNKYHELKEEAQKTQGRLSTYTKEYKGGAIELADKLSYLYYSPEYTRYQLFKEYDRAIGKLDEVLKLTNDAEEAKQIEADIVALKRELIEVVEELGKSER